MAEQRREPKGSESPLASQEESTSHCSSALVNLVWGGYAVIVYALVYLMFWLSTFTEN